MKVVLFEPEIPQNTGNIARTCAVTGSSLTLVKPLGFSLSKRQIKRAGLDYWDDVEVSTIDALEVNPHMLFFSTKGKKLYCDAPFSAESVLVFGSESRGLPQWVHDQHSEQFYTIPMLKGQRSLNLSNSVAIVLYEAYRRFDYAFPKKIKTSSLRTVKSA
ncbi:MAG: tRNA (cytidine(34)-2'-O)-methyltransferase [Chlamydiales bacterium]|nr:tRNA (cytidine(34)-2'-O)-methyltransferase [Chlamydiales bacterium]